MTDFKSDLADASGLGSVIAAELAVADHDDAPAEVVVDSVHDTRSSRGAKATAEEYLNDGTDLFVDLAGDAAAEAVQQVAGDGGAVVMAVGATSTHLAGAYCGKTGFHWSPDLSVIMRLTDLDKRREAKTGTMFVFGGGRRDALRSTYEVGSSQWGRNVAGQIFITDLRHIGLYATNGMTIMTPYYWDATAAGRAFAERFKARYGAPPSYIQAGVYSAVSHYLKAVKHSGGDDPVAVSRSIRAIKPQDFYARNARIREDGQLIQEIYLMQVKAPNETGAPWDYLKTVKTFQGEDVYAPIKFSGCSRLQTLTADGG